MPEVLKFLSPYTKEDSKYYFGREDEIEMLYEKVKVNIITLFYGLSGTGKTSLILCGLSNKFDRTDWMSFVIRRSNNSDIISAMKSILQKEYKIDDVHLLLDKIYYKYYRPIYLIFDQFEEIFIYGDKSEKVEFIKFLLDVKNQNPYVKVIIVLREEYFVNLDDFESAIPEIFQSRVRLEPMTIEKVKKTIINIGKSVRVNISDKIAERIIPHITSRSSDNQSENNEVVIQKNRIELPYLQVYFQEMINVKLKGKLSDLPENQLLELKDDDLPDLGSINDVLSDFLDNSVKSINKKMSGANGEFNSELIWQVLSALVSSEGTKQEKTLDELQTEIA